MWNTAGRKPVFTGWDCQYRGPVWDRGLAR
jgi:hypothetical protein